MNFLPVFIIMMSAQSWAGPQIEKLKSNLEASYNNLNTTWTKGNIWYQVTGSSVAADYLKSTAVLKDVVQDVRSLVNSVADPNDSTSPSSLCETSKHSIKKAETIIESMSLIPTGDCLLTLRAAKQIRGSYCYGLVPDPVLKKYWNYRSQE